MRRLLLSLLLVASGATAQETYKCATPSGPVYQDRPCASAKSTVRVVAGAAPSAAAPTTAMDREKGYLESRNKDRKRAEVTQLEQDIADLQKRMNAEMDDLRNRKGYARNNLAGAMWEQSLSTEMQAVASKYAAEIDAKQERIKRLRAELDR